MTTKLGRLMLVAIALLAVLLVGNATVLARKGKGGGGGQGGGGGGGTTPPTYNITYLGTLGGNWSMTYGMNNNGDVVGASERADGTSGPYVYTAANGMQDLNNLAPNTGLHSARDLTFGPDNNGDGNSDLYVLSSGGNNSSDNSNSVLVWTVPTPACTSTGSADKLCQASDIKELNCSDGAVNTSRRTPASEQVHRHTSLSRTM